MVIYHPEKIRKVILKISGEILAGKKGHGFDDEVIDRITDEVIELKTLGYKIAIVLGGGNIFRGGKWKNTALDRVVLDNIGMLATIQNAIYLAEIIKLKNVSAEVFTAIEINRVAKLYTPSCAKEAINQGKIVFLSGGTGNPFFTTDTGAILRAIEMEMDIVLKGTKVDGLYNDDPALNPQADFINNATFSDCLEKKLGVMDLTAFSLAYEYKIPIKIFNIMKQGMMKEALLTNIGTFIHP